ncbi:MAG: hypothetical protein WCG47_19950 [Dermatophilaceae bacterium]
MFGFHTLQADPQRSQALVAGVRILAFAEREDPKPTRVISPDGRPWTGEQPTGIDYGGGSTRSTRASLDEWDRFFLAMLKQLGIEQGNRSPRRKAGRPAHPAGHRRAAHGPGQHLRLALRGMAVLAGPAVGPRDRARHLSAARDQLDELLERAPRFYEAGSIPSAMKSQTPGVGQAYLGCYTGPDPTRAGRRSRLPLHVPANPLTKLSRSATVST